MLYRFNSDLKKNGRMKRKEKKNKKRRGGGVIYSKIK
jgi:hypothetical protein